MQVAEILEQKGSEVVTTRPQTTIGDVARTLERERIGAALVTGENEEMLGIISERDIVGSIARHGPESLNMHVSELMTSPVVTCASETDTEELMATMLERHIRHLPVVREGELLGIISIGDVVKNVVGELKWMRDALQGQIVKSTGWSTDED